MSYGGRSCSPTPPPAKRLKLAQYVPLQPPIKRLETNISSPPPLMTEENLVTIYEGIKNMITTIKIKTEELMKVQSEMMI